MLSTNDFHPENKARIRYWLGESYFDDYHHILHKENPTDSQKDRLNRYLKKIKTHQNYKKIDHIDALVDWIQGHEQQIYLTITLKKAFVQPNGSLKNLEFENAEKVAVYLKNKITKAFLGRRKNLNFFPFLQLNKDDRYHLHITFSNPKNYSIDDIKSGEKVYH